MEENKTRIIHARYSLADQSKLKEGIVEKRKEYIDLFDVVEVELEKFKKDNPEIYAVYFFSPENKEFSIYDGEALDQTQRKLCQNFLNLLNSKADFYLKDNEIQK